MRPATTEEIYHRDANGYEREGIVYPDNGDVKAEVETEEQA